MIAERLRRALVSAARITYDRAVLVASWLRMVGVGRAGSRRTISQ